MPKYLRPYVNELILFKMLKMLDFLCCTALFRWCVSLLPPWDYPWVYGGESCTLMVKSVQHGTYQAKDDWGSVPWSCECTTAWVGFHEWEGNAAEMTDYEEINIFFVCIAELSIHTLSTDVLDSFLLLFSCILPARVWHGSLRLWSSH